MTEVTVVSVMYNAEDVVLNFLQSLSNNKHIKQIIIVDNDSNDLTCDLVRGCGLDHVSLLHAGANVGFGNGCNIGLEKVETPYALLLNPDAEISEESLAVLLATFAKYDDVAIVAPSILLPDGGYQESYKKEVFAREASAGNFVLPDGDICAGFLSGAVMLWNMDLMRKVGFFDPQIFLFYEDDDICLQVKKAGYGLVYAPDAKAHHVMGGSTTHNKRVESLKQYHLSWSRLYLQAKYFGRKNARKLALSTLMLFFLKQAGYSVIGRFEKSRKYNARVRAVKDFLRGNDGEE